MQNVYEWGNRGNVTLVFLHGMGSTGLSFGELAQYLSRRTRGSCREYKRLGQQTDRLIGSGEYR